MRRMFLLLLPPLLLLPGCFTSKAPQISVVEVRSTPSAIASATSSPTSSPDAQRAVLLIVLEATNPNAKPLPLKDVHYTIDINGATVFTGTRDAQATLRRYGTQRITLPAPLDANLPAPGTPFRVRGSVTYIAPEVLAKTLFDNQLTDWSRSFSGTGEITAE
jgi:hypothetical protein